MMVTKAISAVASFINVSSMLNEIGRYKVYSVTCVNTYDSEGLAQQSLVLVKIVCPFFALV